MVVVSPLNAPINDQISKCNALGVCCASLCLCGEETDGRFQGSFQESLQTKISAHSFPPRGSSKQQAL